MTEEITTRAMKGARAEAEARFGSAVMLGEVAGAEGEMLFEGDALEGDLEAGEADEVDEVVPEGEVEAEVVAEGVVEVEVVAEGEVEDEES
jgi:hypothetical protein